jgi:hypothetical protein
MTVILAPSFSHFPLDSNTPSFHRRTSMHRQTMIATALALVSLGAACTSSERVGLTMTRPAAAGATGSSSGYAIVPPSDDPAEIAAPPPASTPLATALFASSGAGGTGGTGGTAATGTCAAPPPVMPPIPMATTPKPDLSGPTVIATSAPRPVSGGTLLVLRDGSAAVASDSDRDVVYVVDLNTRALRATAVLDTGDEPGRLVEDGAGLVHVALRRGGAVVTIDPTTGLIVDRQAVCAAPRGLAYDASGDLVHVACAEGTLVSLRATGGVARTVTLRRDLRDVVVTGAGQLLVSTFKTADVLVLDASGAVTSDVRPPARRGVSSMTGQPRTLSPAVAWRMVSVGGTGALLLHQRGVDDPVVPAAGGYAAGKGCDGIVESTATVVTPSTTPGTSAALGMVTLAVDVAVSPDGQTMAIAAAGNTHAPLSSVVQMPIASSTQNPGGCMFGAPPPAPNGAPPPPGQVVAVSYAANGTLVAQSREPAVLWTSDGQAPISLSSQPASDTGHQLFHVDAGGGIACASCHPEGGEDGRTWSFACLGPRRTQSLRGGLSGTEPFHWDGDMSNFSDLVQAVFVGRMSGPQPRADQTAALLHWLDGITELPNPPPAAPAAVERGRALFASAAVGCSACHAGAHLTNNATVDVGTGMKLQVPSLRGVGWRAPFLHTGCAPTLADRFGACGGGDQHGHTSQLQAGDVADLTAYLETL